jgi:GH25 family lysozyme M1 (1,4-beta-N-acetylmuramidase)
MGASMRIGAVVAAISFVCMYLTPSAHGQDQLKGPPDLATLRKLRLIESGAVSREPAAIENALASKWPLNIGARPGTYGIDLSHYETQPCAIDLQKLTTYGLRFAYLETTRGIKIFSSVSKVWSALAPMHTAKTLYRGAYHFLLPNAILKDANGHSLNLSPTDASAQAGAFLTSIGAGPGKTVSELAPILDIEPTGTPVDFNTDDWNNCPINRRSTVTNDGKTTYYCDMWYKVPNQKDIATLAANWADAVKQATGQSVTIYSSPGSWGQVIGPSPTGQPILSGRAIWLAHYTLGQPGPAEPTDNSTWTPQSWDNTWNMPALLDNTPYPKPVYNVPNFWQFSVTGTLPGTVTGTPSSGPFSCDNAPDNPLGKLDFSFVPLTGTQFESVFNAR